MKGKTLYIVLGVIILFIIIFFVWNSNKQKTLEAKAKRDREIQMQNLVQGSTPGNNTATGGLTNTVNSISGLIGQLSGLFGGSKPSAADSTGNGNYSQFLNECEMLYNTTEEVETCAQAKMNGLV